MKAYKLFRVRADGTLGPLFINASQRIPVGEWLSSEYHPTKGFAVRQGWHALPQPSSTRLSEQGRAWYQVELDGATVIPRSDGQGGTFIVADRLKVLRRI